MGFERSESFAFDKPAGTPCRWLGRDDRCAQHERRGVAGLSGCQSYDCYGAGQRACRLFAGTSWRDGPDSARALFATFRRLQQLHELRWLLHETARLALEPGDARDRARLLAELEPDPEPSREDLAALDLDALDVRTRRFLRGLRRYFPEPPARRRLPTLSG